MSKHYLKLLFLCLSVLFLGCSLPAKYVSRSSTAYSNHIRTNETTVIRHYYIDPSFKGTTSSQVEAGFDEWNIALNGYQKFVKGSLNGVAKDSELPPFDFLVVNVSSKDATDMLMPEGVLGWVDELGSPVIYLVEDRMTDQDIRILLMHELGHSLGLPHLPVKGTLMYPYYPNSPCIDEITIRELVTVGRGHYQLEHLNWCEFKIN